MKRASLILATLALMVSVGEAKAGLIEVTSRSSLGGNDFVNWGQLGPNGTTIPNPFSVTSNGGVTLTVSQAGASSFERLDQGTGWAGNFAPGDQLLWTAGANGPVTMSYGLTNGVDAIGTQLQSDFYGSFTATITAYDSSHNVLGSFTETGNSTNAGNNSAIFLGVQSTSNNIFSITYSVTSSGGQDFGINRLDFGKLPPSATPEPGSLTLLGLGACGLVGYNWRRKRSVREA